MIEKDYLKLLELIYKTGISIPDRTGVGTYQMFGANLRHNLADGFPLLTTKKLHFKSIVHELIWFLKGDTNIRYLIENNVHIWNEWVKSDGTIGPGYGKQWRNWKGEGNSGHGFSHDENYDQVRMLIDRLKNNPYDRRAIVSAWNVDDLQWMALPPCHLLWQVNLQPVHAEGVNAYMKFQKGIVSKHDGWEYAKSQYEKRTAKYKLNLSMYQRSSDMFLGVPFNIASYALLMVLLCNELDAIPGTFIWNSGDTHIYQNHLPQVREQLERVKYIKDLPVVHVDRDATVDNIKFEDVRLYHYNPLPAIKAPVAV
jgi:thymidylate synthase